MPAGRLAGIEHRVSEVLLDLQNRVPFVGAVITVRRPPRGDDVPLLVYRHEGRRLRVPAPSEAEARLPHLDRDVPPRVSGFSTTLTRGDLVVGRLYLVFERDDDFTGYEKTTLKAAKARLDEEISTLVSMGDVGLTCRELEVLELMAEGMSNGEIATVLWISPFTVKSHVEKVLVKLDAANRVQAVRIAASRAII